MNDELKVYLDRLMARLGTRALIAEKLGVKYTTVAHWFDGSSLPSFTLTLRILRYLGDI